MSIRCEPVAWTAALSSAFMALSVASRRSRPRFPPRPSAGASSQPRPGAHAGQQRLVLGGGLLHRCPASQQFQEQAGQPAGGLRPGSGQLIPPAAAAAPPSAPDRCSVPARALLHCAMSAQPRSTGSVRGSDHQRELVEDHAQLAAVRGIGGDVVVAAAEVLHQCMTGGEDPR
jgi:hypothetical protein